MNRGGYHYVLAGFVSAVYFLSERRLFVISPPGYAGRLMLCWCYFLFLKCRPYHSTMGGRIVALIPSMDRLLRLRMWCSSVKGRCHGNQFCGARRRQVGIPRLYCLCWHFTTDWNIPTPIAALTSTMTPLRLLQMGDMAKIRCALIFKGYSLDGSSIASL